MCSFITIMTITLRNIIVMALVSVCAFFLYWLGPFTLSQTVNKHTSCVIIIMLTEVYFRSSSWSSSHVFTGLLVYPRKLKLHYHRLRSEEAHTTIVSHLSCYCGRKLYRVESLHAPRNPVTAAEIQGHDKRDTLNMSKQHKSHSPHLVTKDVQARKIV